MKNDFDIRIGKIFVNLIKILYQHFKFIYHEWGSHSLFLINKLVIRNYNLLCKIIIDNCRC